MAFEMIAETVCEDIEKGRRPTSDIEKVVKRIDTCMAASAKAYCLSGLAVAAWSNEDSDEDLKADIRARLSDAFAGLASPRMKHSLACQIVTRVGSTAPGIATDMLSYLADRDKATAVAANVEEGVYCALDLLVKGACALARAQLLEEDDVKRICSMISEVEEPYLQVSLFSTLAFCLWQEGQRLFSSEIVNQSIWPVLSDLGHMDERLYCECWMSAYPAVWLDDRDRARSAVAQLPEGVKNKCRSTLAFALLRRHPPGEPFDDDSRHSAPELTYSVIQILLGLCEETTEDFIILAVAQWLADEVTSKRSRSRITRDQRAEAARRVIRNAELRLPRAERITHLGYQILVKAQGLRIAEIAECSWDSLIKQAEELDTAADRVHVLAHLAAALPRKRKKQKERLLALAESDADRLDSVEDRFERHFGIAKILADDDKVRATRSIKKAYESVTALGGGRQAMRENHLVELAYKIEEELPMRMAVLYDDDPAKEQYKERAQRQLDGHKLRTEIGDQRSSIDLASREADPNLAEAAWRALGTLNAGRMMASDVGRLREMLVCAGNYPLISSYPMYSWALSNLMLKYAQTPEAGNYIRSAFEGVLLGADFMFRFAKTGGAFGTGPGPDWRDVEEAESHVVIQVGERRKALEYLRSWLENNAHEYVTIIDPFFGPDDLELVFMISDVDPELRVRVLTGKARHDTIEGSLPMAYANVWKKLCDHSPPDTEIVVVKKMVGGDTPFHDRWILSTEGGLRLGTSFNGFGSKDSEISILRSQERRDIGAIADRYGDKRRRVVDGVRIAYESFDLWTQ